MKELLDTLGLHFPDGVPVAALPAVLRIGRDLLDGDLHLSEQSRADLGELIEASKRCEL